jgi:D-serine deaminase-like pyridoxal phosphate-dependent protein
MAVTMDETRLQALYEDVLDWRYKSIPPAAHGKTLAEWIASVPVEDDLETPSLALFAGALDHNATAMAAWCAERGLALAPHGKATMAPQLWRRQLDAGAVGITVANAFQAGVARQFGVPRVLIANQVTDPAAIARISDGAADLAVFADSPEAVDLLADHANAPIDVLVELGADGGRAGARGCASVLRVADAIRAAPNLRLAGVAGYEGAAASGTDAAALAAVDAYLHDLAALFAALDFDVDRPVITAGGSAYFDRVAAVLGPLASEAEVVLRSGSYLVHDHGCYARWTPSARGADGPELRPALSARARVLAVPEPGLAILDGGRRDLPFDQDLPIPLGLKDARCSQISDQHLFLTGDLEHLAVGSVVELGLSHPCTSFDKWRLIPVVDEETGQILDAVRTWF